MSKDYINCGGCTSPMDRVNNQIAEIDARIVYLKEELKLYRETKQELLEKRKRVRASKQTTGIVP
jgi:predicted  nucleic acid-binding Zn-ribbon protein